jgi:aspartyl-tRNA(Asn)/glutamyl-tRNA(Gln) amidotransferase subunit A
LSAAEAADAALAAGEVVGPLHGIPIGIKDLITTAEGPTTAQSLVHDTGSFTGDAEVVRRLRGAGAIIMGKLSTCEFALGMPDETKPFPLPRNPWSLDHWAGGSSSGSGSAVAIGAVLGALGTDTGGSIRCPSAYCGITGLLPTFGRVPKSGCIPLSYSLDHIGPMARSVRDCALMLEVMAGPHESDPTSLIEPVPSFTAGMTGDLSGVRIGVDRLDEYGGKVEDTALGTVFEEAVSVLADRGAEIVAVRLPFYPEMTTAAWLIMMGEALAYHRDDLREQWDRFGASTRQTLMTGTLYSASDYVQAQRARRAGQRALAALYRDVDLVVTPTLAAGAVPLTALGGSVSVDCDFLEGIYTSYWDATGNPVVAMPIGFTGNGLPLSMQVAGRPFDEQLVLAAGDAYQQHTNWHLRMPSLDRPTIGLTNHTV